MKYYFVFSTLFFYLSLGAQDYWQQEVNYKINVSLDDELHFLNGEISIEYINNSPDELAFLYFHLWPNAYSNGQTALSEQLYQEGNDILKFASEEDKGFIDSLEFKIAGNKVDWELDPIHCDIAKITLPNPIRTGESVLIHTPFRVKIPSGKISRLGHIKQSYQITQWYPKPAVYDKDGWHQMPYLNQGEFYSEFGNFDVQITLPENYVVGATGDLQTTSEMEFLDQLAEQTLNTLSEEPTDNEKPKGVDLQPISSSNWKTIRYIQSDVHDFAWFADKSYKVLKGEVELPHSKRKVTTWAMYTPRNEFIWKKAIEYLNDGTFYYSLWNGDYPYSQVTAVDGTISAGGGMEYPNVTVIGNSGSAMELEIVIVHEVGHNWFYGILGSNERDHGWMDEGMNTLNEVRYIQTKYPENTYLANMIANGKFNFHGLSYHDFNDLTTRTISALGVDQPIETESASFRSLNYGVIMYQKTGLVFDYLKYYLGEETFDLAMQNYFNSWKFKHPQPIDIQNAIETSCNKDLDWVFSDLIQTTNQIDYKISRVKKGESITEVKLKNKGQVNGPIPVSVVDNGKIRETKWLDSQKGWVSFEGTVSELMIDPNRQILELNRRNNSWNQKRIFNKMEPIKPNFLFGYNRSEESNIYIAPAFGVNNYDQFMLGLSMHNLGVSFQPLRYFVAPMYSFGRKSCSGIGEISYSLFPKGKIKQTVFGISLKSFKDDNFYVGNESFYAIGSPYISLTWSDDSKHNPIEQNLRIISHNKISQRGSSRIPEIGASIIHQINYKERDHQLEMNARNDFIDYELNNDKLARIMLETTYKWRYHKRKFSSWIESRFFVGYNYQFQASTAGNAYRYGMSLAGKDGLQDVFNEEYFFNRGATSGLFEHQRQENMGGFRTTSSFGTTDSWLVSSNIFVQLPIKLNILGVFADFGAFEKDGATEGVFNAGIGVRVSNILGVYFPLIQSTNLLNAYASDSYAERIRFTLNLNFVNSGNLRRLFVR